jgi:carboxyl-terminal processing protease
MLEEVRRNDDYALFYDPKGYEDFRAYTKGSFSGIGVVLDQRKDRLEVLSVLPSTPAEDAGLQPGDVLVEVDGAAVAEMTVDEAVASVKGPPGSEVMITVERSDEERTFEITRETIELPNLTGRMTADSVGYIRLYGFSDGAGNELRSEVADMERQGAEGIVLDMRDNGGGLFSEAIEVASVFIEDGEIVSFKEPSSEEVVYDAEGDAYEDVPVVVLVNQRTASASEIVAGALQDRDRAPVVGTTTFGKGSVQEVLPLPDGSAVKLTTGAYFTPDGTDINGTGIQPDVVVDAGPARQRAKALQVLENTASAG